jgi:hypothetical protein
MAHQAPWRLDGDFRRQNEILKSTDHILSDPLTPQAVKDVRLRQLSENVSVRRQAKEPDWSDAGSVARAVIREAVASSSEDDVETIGRLK